MPLGLWKSKWEIHREEMARRDAEWRAEMDRRDAEWRAEREESRQHWEKMFAEHRQLNGEMLARMDERLEKFEAKLNSLEQQVVYLRKETVDALSSMNNAILRLIDRFDEFEGRPPSRAA